MSGVLLVVVGFVTIAYKELKIGIFDPILAGRFGLRPTLLQVCWLGVVSITTVAAFDVAGRPGSIQFCGAIYVNV